MAAFTSAVEVGADAIELDVHLTRDGTLVVVHDFDLGRTTDGEGLVHECDLGYVRSLSAGKWFAESFAAERVPLLDEVLALPVPAVELEVKGLPSKALVAGVAYAVSVSGRSGSTEITGHHHQMVTAIKHRIAGVRSGYFSPKRENWMSKELYQQLVEHSVMFGDFDIVHARLDELRALDVARLHDLGLLVHASDVNGTDEVEEAVALGADHLTTKDPDAVLRALGA